MQQVAAVADVARNNSGRIKVAEAARKLAINRSSLGRYLENYRELLDERGRVDFEELAQHRRDNPQVSDAGDRQKSTSTPRMAEREGTRHGNKHRLEEIKAWEAEREWAKSVGQLVDPATIIDALAESAVALRDKFMAPDPTLCERIAGETDPRAVMTLLREANRAALDDFAAAMKRIAAASPATSDAGA